MYIAVWSQSIDETVLHICLLNTHCGLFNLRPEAIAS
jgi:hypothetical protein